MNMDFVTMNLVTLLYLVASICFIQALKGLSHPTTSIRGNVFGMLGMTIAVITTAALILKLSGSAMGMGWVLGGLVIGGSAGTLMAQRVEMTKMPELVAFMHSMIGLAAVFIGVAAVAEPWAFGITPPPEEVASGMQTSSGMVITEMMRRFPIPTGNRLELFLGAAIGAITFSGSVIAFGKLSGKYKFRLFQGAPVSFAGQHMLNLVLGLATIGLGLMFVATENWTAFLAMLFLSFVMGVLIIIPIGGADMPVVVSMLNSYSGWAAAGIGFSLNNSMLIIAGSLVGSSGAILSYIMCKAMNRSFFNVILGGFGGEAGTAAAGTPVPAPATAGVATAPVAGAAAVVGQALPSAAATATAPAAPPAPAASAAKAAEDNISFIWPTEGTVIAGFDDAKNKGIDIAGKAGQPVVAAADGRVAYVGAAIRGLGNLIILKHSNTMFTAYAHNQTLLVKEDQTVKQGQKIAEMGSSDTDRIKLHFEIRRKGTPVDPVKLLPAR